MRLTFVTHLKIMMWLTVILLEKNFYLIIPMTNGYLCLLSADQCRINTNVERFVSDEYDMQISKHCMRYSNSLTKPATFSKKCPHQESIPFSSLPKGSARLNGQIECQKQRLCELNNEVHTFEDSLLILRHECRQLVLNGGDPDLIRSLDHLISDKIEEHAWKPKALERVRRKLKNSRTRAGFIRIECAYLALSKDPNAPIQNVTNVSTIAGVSNASEDELSSSVVTTSK